MITDVQLVGIRGPTAKSLIVSAGISDVPGQDLIGLKMGSHVVNKNGVALTQLVGFAKFDDVSDRVGVNDAEVADSRMDEWVK